MLKKRDYLFDNIKALLIISVVTAHYFRVSGDFAVGSAPRVIYIIAFSYIMQGFFFISGYFSKNVDKCRRGAFKNFIIPYLLFCVLVFGERYLLYGNAHLHLLRPTFALWFLVAMFVYRFLIKDMARIPFLLPAAAVLYLAAGLIPVLDQDCSLGRLASFLVFYLAGFKCSGETIEKIRRIPKVLTFLLLAVLTGICIAEGFMQVDMESYLMRRPISEYGVTAPDYLLTRVQLLVEAAGWIVVFINMMPRKRTPLSGLGQRTMTVYLLHIFIRNLLKFYNVPFEGTIWYYLIVVGLVISSLYLFSRPAVDRAYNRIIDLLYRPFDWVVQLVRKVGTRLTREWKQ